MSSELDPSPRDEEPWPAASLEGEEPAAEPAGANEPAQANEPPAEVTSELEVAEVDPIVQAELQDMVSDVAALVEPTFEEPVPGEAGLESQMAEAEPPAAPDDLAAAGDPAALAAAVEAELQAEALAEPESGPAAPVDADDGAPVTSESELAIAAEAPDATTMETVVANEAGQSAETETAPPEPAPAAQRSEEGAAEAPAPEKPKKRGRKAREPRPPPLAAAAAVEGLSQAAEMAVVSSAGLAEAGPLSLEALVESLLFVADGAVPVGRLAEALEIQPREVEAALAALVESYQTRGLSLQRFRDRVQLTTAPAAAPLVERFLGLAASTPLSRAALEALAIVAYQQPVTRPQIEAVRGVNSDSVIKNLLTKGLIEESGRAEGPGRPVLYSTTSEFMQHFGLATLSDLPPLTPPSSENGSETISELLKG